MGGHCRYLMTPTRPPSLRDNGRPPIKSRAGSPPKGGGIKIARALTSPRRGCSSWFDECLQFQTVAARPLALPNLLTYGRIAAVPVVVGLLYWQNIFEGALWLRWVALAIFITAGLTDILDGYLARTWGQQSFARSHA